MTGHEHLPCNAVKDTLFGKIQNLKGGQFLAHSFSKDFNKDFCNNRFQLINIDHDKNEIGYEIFTYQKNPKNNEYEFLSFNSDNQQKCEYKTAEIEFDKAEINVLQKLYLRDEYNDYFYFEIKNDWLNIYPKSECFYETIKSENVIKLIYNLILENDINYVKFILHDVFSFKDACDLYSKKRKQKE